MMVPAMMAPQLSTEGSNYKDTKGGAGESQMIGT
jgi:hypothetical protein